MPKYSMANDDVQCHDKRLVGHLVWHEVRFHGPDMRRMCDLPISREGDVRHSFINGSIYSLTFISTIMTDPGCLTVVGDPTPPPVRVPRSKQGAFLTSYTTGQASQTLRHVSGFDIRLPHTASAEFATSVMAPWGSLPVPDQKPIISVTLVS
jgi:hypothetical protein